MATLRQIDEDKLIDRHDIDAVKAQRDPVVREAMVCSLTTYRQPDRLFVGDAVPSLKLAHLGNGEKITFKPENGKPLVLFFGSYT